MRAAEVGHEFCGFGAVQNNFQVTPGFVPDGVNFGEFLRCDTDGVENVLHAVFGKVARFSERGDRGGAFGRRHLQSGDVD